MGCAARPPLCRLFELTKRVLVTGGAGFIGSHVVDALVAAGHQVVVIDDLSTGSRENLHRAATFHQLDITDPEIDSWVEDARPEVICHNAAQISVTAGQRSPLRDLSVNAGGSLRLIECAARIGCRFVHASSAAVYGEPENVPVTEDHPTRPINNYGVSKLAVEHYLAAYARSYGLEYAALRYANVYGPRQNASGEAGVVAIFCEAMARGAEVTIHGDGRQTRDFVFVGDVAAANVAAAESEATGVFNISTGVETDINTLYDEIARAFGRTAAPAHGPERPGDIERSVLDAGRAADLLGWRAKVAVSVGLEATSRWFMSRAGAE